MTAPDLAYTNTATSPKTSRWRRYSARFLLFLFCLSMVLSLITIWTHNQLNDTDRYVRTVAPLATEPAMQTAIADQVSVWLGTAIEDVVTRDGLREREGLLAAPLIRLLQQYVDETVHDYVASPAFPALWDEINRVEHHVVAAILAGEDAGNFSTADGRITLELMPLVTEVINRLRENGVDVVDRIQIEQLDTTYVIFQSDDLSKIQDAIRFLGWLAMAFPVLALISLGGYIGLSTGRWQAVIRAGIGLTVTMTLFLLLLAFARWMYLDRLNATTDQEVAAVFLDTIARYIRAAARLLVLVGVVIAAFGAVFRPGGLVGRKRPESGWIATAWRFASEKSPWLAKAGLWTDGHRKGLAISLIAGGCLAIAARDHLTLGWGATVLLISMIGFGALALLRPVFSDTEAADLTSVAAAPGNSDSVLERDSSTVWSVTDSGQAAHVEDGGELSVADVAMLQRFAAALRDASL